ncbi:hypothetical protein EB796_018917 [Bugula neritina]|uniref:Fe2OG dioxygenase domain-containing protein n=1 Tax=Bugula neritina TaxID=10212 RepID=A0A7J7JAW2_BUGNE|nr:hypothetical protein EB796_018917 [Bugula neritina]
MEKPIVPVIDFTAGQSIPGDAALLWKTTPEQISLADDIISALKNVGFICLVNTGITQDEMDTLMNEVKQFFGLGGSEKCLYTKGLMSNTGWVDVGRETLSTDRKAGDYKETFNFQPVMAETEIPDSMKILKEWWGRLSTLSLQFMKLMGLGLRMKDPSYIANSHSFGSSQNESAIRVNFYPATVNKDLEPGQVRCGEHSDYGSVTLLIQDSPGLEVMNRSTGEYEAVTAPPGGIIVNIGDVMQFWTSDTLVANKHRVLVSDDKHLQEADRISIPFFAIPDQTTLIECLVGRSKYPPVTMHEWLKQKIDSAFKERV